MAWTQTELELIGRAEELELASRSHDGALSPFVTMWVVRVSDEIYVRSAGGASRPWFQRATSSGTGHICAGAIEAEVAFDEGPVGADIEIDASYHEKYDRYGATIVGHVTGPEAHPGTIRLIRQARSESHDAGQRRTGGSNIVSSLLEPTFRRAAPPEMTAHFGLASRITPGQRTRRGSNIVPSPPPSPPPRSEGVFASDKLQRLRIAPVLPRFCPGLDSGLRPKISQ